MRGSEVRIVVVVSFRVKSTEFMRAEWPGDIF